MNLLQYSPFLQNIFSLAEVYFHFDFLWSSFTKEHKTNAIINQEKQNRTNLHLEPCDYWIYYVNIGLLHQYVISVTDVPPDEMSLAAKSEEGQLFSQARK